MEVMEDGNLMDRIRVLIQRDLQYYQDKQTVLQESMCPGVVGGKLDFPKNSSFAAVKLVLWWEEEYIAAYRKNSGLMQGSLSGQDLDDVSGGCGGIVKSSDPRKFVAMVIKSAEQLLDHLHVLSQEALDHADLTVLTATIGASALIKNCVWCYIQSSGGSPVQSESGTLQKSHKEYSEMAEALAERLLDLHCRLMSLYILQDAESLDWENSQPFFESERGSFTIQMWWFYMHGTKEDLWSTVPPKIAQRVFSGMLNESLTILTVRYLQAHPSKARSPLLVVDISNILLCVMHMLFTVCENVDELMGLSLYSQNKIIRDIHSKCHELLCCFLLRGAPLEILHKVFKRGVEHVGILKPRSGSPSPWLFLTAPELIMKQDNSIITKTADLDTGGALALELRVLLAQPQANWPGLLKILLMCKCKVASLILKHIIPQTIHYTCEQDEIQEVNDCGGFLCNGDGICQYPNLSTTTSQRFYLQMVASVVQIITTVCTKEEIKITLLPALESCGRQWALPLDRQQVWNLNKPPWLNSIISHLKPILSTIVNVVITAVQTGASMYQAMSLTLACFQQLWNCVPNNISQIATLLSDILPADVHPLGQSVLLQLLITALYKELFERVRDEDKRAIPDPTGEVKETAKACTSTGTVLHKDSIASFDGTVSSVQAIANALGEALCTIDEDNKHTEQIDELLAHAKIKEDQDMTADVIQEQTPYLSEVMASEILMNSEGKFSFKVLHHFVKHNYLWILKELGVKTNEPLVEPNRLETAETSMLFHAFHIGDRPFDQILTGEWKPDWQYLLSIPMGLGLDRVWSHISQRWEFRETDASQLSAHDAAVVAALGAVFQST